MIIIRTNENDKNISFYPFHVAERDEQGNIQFARLQHIMHGFAVVPGIDMHKQIFDMDNNELPNGSAVYEIRVKSKYGEWQDWQAIIGNFRIVSFVDWQFGQDMNSTYAGLGARFNEVFEIRYCGTLFRSPTDGGVQVINDDDKIIRTINRITLQIEYYSQISNMCYPLEEQIDDMIRFRKLYYAYDENDNRI